MGHLERVYLLKRKVRVGVLLSLNFRKNGEFHYESESVGKAQMRILPGDQTPGCDLCDLFPESPSQTASGLTYN